MHEGGKATIKMSILQRFLQQIPIIVKYRNRKTKRTLNNGKNINTTKLCLVEVLLNCIVLAKLQIPNNHSPSHSSNYPHFHPNHLNHPSSSSKRLPVHPKQLQSKASWPHRSNHSLLSWKWSETKLIYKSFAIYKMIS